MTQNALKLTVIVSTESVGYGEVIKTFSNCFHLSETINCTVKATKVVFLS